MAFIFIALLFILISLALWIKIKSISIKRSDFPEEIISSPFSRALAELVAIAGGIYLSLVMLITFLKLEIPNSIELVGIAFDPLAGVSVLIALIQPLISYLIFIIRR